MEELSSQIGAVLLRKTCIEKKWDAEIEDIRKKLESFLFSSPQAALSTTPQQIKKKKRLTAITDTEDEENVSQRFSKKNSIACLAIQETELITPDAVDEPVATIVAESESIALTSSRPQRGAKLKAGQNLKEPSVIAKLRRGSNDTVINEDKIKKEKDDPPRRKASMEVSKHKSGIEAHDTTTSLHTNPTRNEVQMTNKVDESLIIVDPKNSILEVLSEDESEKMPPPPAPPKKRNIRTKKNTTTESSDCNQIKIKTEKQSLGSVISNATASTNITDVEMVEASSNLESNDQEEFEKEDDDKEKSSSRKGGKKTKKSKYKPIKVERFSDVSPPSSRTRKTSKDKSIESVYEDAEDVPMSAVLEIAKKARTLSLVTAQNATFVTTSDVSPDLQNQQTISAQNETYLTTSDQMTFVLGANPNTTITVDPDGQHILESNDATFNVKEIAGKQRSNSIMTEDESFEVPKASSEKVVKTKVNAKELFNPCVPSPVKKIVEAFEKAAAGQGSPPQRQTRTKTRAKTKENEDPVHNVIKEIKATSSLSSTTPIIGKHGGPVLGRFLTPTQQSNVTPILGGLVKKMPNSASKIMTFPTLKASTVSASKSSGGSSSSQSMSRENSVEDLKRGYNKLQQLAEERKKKREQKQQQAAQAREAKEKERAERLKKLMDEREEKQRKKALESEQKKRELEEINRNIKLQEHKRLEKQKIEREMAEAARKEREMLEQMRIEKTKQEIKMKMQNQKLALQKKLQSSKLMKIYDFEMLNSDDSTDDEGKTSIKRPPPPSWSTSSVRAPLIDRQAFLNTKIIDSFFSVQPMTPDLKEIFPEIDPRYLKRNSSVIWRTPPRYSEMPKY